MAAFYTFEDFSGSNSNEKKTDNPYHDLIEACHDNPGEIQTRYNTHRTNRNQQQREKLLAPEFSGMVVDEILAKLNDPVRWPGFEDPRHCLVFWARPTLAVRTLIAEIQSRLLALAPTSLWIMQPESLHMTALEITHSLTAPKIEELVSTLLPNARAIAEFPQQHRARVVKPLLSFDAQALALSFLPADGEPGRSSEADAYTYHHLRRDLHTFASKSGVVVASRYVIPSAHLTIGRFINRQDFETDATGSVNREKVARWVAAIDEINTWLQREYWPQDGKIKPGGEWIVGEGKGLDFRKGALWYGYGGETVLLGQGF